MTTTLVKENGNELLLGYMQIIYFWQGVGLTQASSYFGDKYSNYRNIANELIGIKNDLIAVKNSGLQDVDKYKQCAGLIGSLMSIVNQNPCFLEETIHCMDKMSYNRVSI